MSAVPLAAQAFCVCPVIVTDRLRAPPQACRKIHDCDAARVWIESGAPRSSLNRATEDVLYKFRHHKNNNQQTLGVGRVVAVQLLRAAVLARQRPREEVVEVQRRARRFCIKLPDGVVRQP